MQSAAVREVAAYKMSTAPVTESKAFLDHAWYFTFVCLFPLPA